MSDITTQSRFDAEFAASADVNWNAITLDAEQHRTIAVGIRVAAEVLAVEEMLAEDESVRKHIGIASDALVKVCQVFIDVCRAQPPVIDECDPEGDRLLAELGIDV